MRTRGIRDFLLVSLLFLATVSGVAAHRELLGASPREVILRLGPPDSVYSSDSPIADVNAVVFFYNDYRYVYFHADRVWQVRLDERSEHEVDGLATDSTSGDEESDAVREPDGPDLPHAEEESAATSERSRLAVSPGDDRRSLFEAFGSPLLDDGDSLVFELEDRGYPVRLRAFLDEQDTIVDIYLYRADF